MQEGQSTFDSNPEPVALWNPNAAANWCLLFSAAFGSYLQMLNWRAMGEPEEAAKSQVWFNISIGPLVMYGFVGMIIPNSKTVDGLLRLVGFVFLISWYFGSGRIQARFVKNRFGNGYTKQHWSRPLLIGLGALVGYFVVVFVLAFVAALISP
jgi:hypothetical protein